MTPLCTDAEYDRLRRVEKLAGELARGVLDGAGPLDDLARELQVLIGGK